MAECSADEMNADAEKSMEETQQKTAPEEQQNRDSGRQQRDQKQSLRQRNADCRNETWRKEQADIFRKCRNEQEADSTNETAPVEDE